MSSARQALWAAPDVQHGELSNVELANRRLVAEARLVLVCAAIVVALLEPGGADRAAILSILALYAAVAYAELRRMRAGAREGIPVNHWLDAACYLGVVAISGGLVSDFTIFLLFPIFTACLRSGVRLGVIVAVVCGALLGGMAATGTRLPAEALVPEVPLAALILVIAIVIARWAHTEITIARRLAFCSDVGQAFTPQHDLRRAVSRFCEMVRAYQRADTCIVLLKDPDSRGWLLFQVDADSDAVRGDMLDAATAQPLLVQADDRAFVYRERGRISDEPVCTAHDPATLHAATEIDCGRVAELAQLLEAKSLVTIALQSRNQVLGRLHVTSGRCAYTRSDVEFLVHVAAQVGVMIENMQLVDRLTLEVANEERKKISRDLHDGTIQPYIGLKLALEALHRRVAGHPVLVHEVDDLIKMASDGISQLRHYVGHLKTAVHDDRRGLLLPAIRQQADKFSEYYGIGTEVVGSTDIAVHGALFEEVMYLVREGLSNIRRHTRARTARIGVEVAAGRLTLRISNDTGPDEPHGSTPFSPRSISERTRELGGNVTVDCSRSGTTVVSIEIPV